MSDFTPALMSDVVREQARSREDRLRRAQPRTGLVRGRLSARRHPAAGVR